MATVSANGHVSTLDLISLIETRTGRAGKKVGREVVLECPSHESSESTPSLNVREGDGGFPLIRCRSRGCTPEEILTALDLTWRDVYGDDSEHWTPSGPWIAVYDYQDADGTLLYQVCRTAEKKFSQRRPDPDNPGKWKWNLDGVKRVPYHLPQLLAAVEAKEPIWVVDGERDVQALEREGHAATCCSGGMLKWPQMHSRYLIGATVKIIVDQDPLEKNGKPHAEGQRAALRIHESLQGATSDLELLAPKEGKDAADHLGAGLGVDEFVRVAADELERSLPSAESAPPPVEEQAGEETGGGPVLRFLSGHEFRKQPKARIDPLLGDGSDGILMPGCLALLAGIGGTGKTTLALHAAVHWAAGLPWLGIELARPLRIVLIENEGPHDPFADKVDAICDRFHDCPCGGPPHGDLGAGFDANATVLDAPWGRFSFDSPGLATDLNAHAKEFQADLVIANPLGRLGMKGAGTPEETRAFLSLLVHAGLGNDFAALLIHHMSKGQQKSLSQQISGDWGGHPDTILILEDAGQRRVKLTFDKIRWGDQGARNPMILDWLTDPEGPIGYRGSEAPKGVPDATIYERIDQYLREQVKPPGVTAIRDGVPGQGKRLKELLEEGVSSGRYARSGGARPTYWLTRDALQEAMDV